MIYAPPPSGGAYISGCFCFDSGSDSDSDSDSGSGSDSGSVDSYSDYSF